jgi:hypothetical protein
MTQTVTALYDNYDDAISATRALEDAGIPASEISVVSNNADNRYNPDHTTNAAEDAGKGAGIGAVVGGIGGLLTGLGLMAIPGVGWSQPRSVLRAAPSSAVLRAVWWAP